MDKKILILGAGEGQVPLIKRAKEAGWKTIVVSPKGDYPGFSLADSIRNLDITNKERVLELAIEEKVDAVASDQTDVSMPTVLFVAESLGLPHIQCEDISRFHLKSTMRQVCHENGIPTIPFCIADSVEEAKSFYLSLPNGKAIIKPIDSQGSRGIKKVVSLDEMPMAFSQALGFSKAGRVVIESFIDGEEIEVDSVVKDGTVIATLIGDVYNFNDSYSAYERVYPTQLPRKLQQQIKEDNAQVLKVLGLNTGWTHGEYIVSNGQVFLLEVGARGGGNFIGSHIVKTMLGVGTDEMAFDTACGDDSFYKKVSLRDVYCAYKCFYLPKGVVQSVCIDYELLHQPYVRTHNLDGIHPGVSSHGLIDKTTRYTVVVEANTREQLRNRMLKIENSIKINVLTEVGILGVVWR